MVTEFQGFSPNSLSSRLIKGLTDIPQDWGLVPIGNEKRPIGDGWQNRPYTPQQMAEIVARGVNVPIKGIDKKIYSNQIKGYGIITGTVIQRGAETYYLMALDLDGESASSKMLEMSGGEELPKTVSFSSGRPGRSQHLFLVPQQYIDDIKTKKYQTGVTGDDDKPEQVELRFKNLQSVLPPSVHPMTGQYHWLPGCSPSEIEVAIAPMWIIENMLVERKEALPQQSKNTQPNRIQYPRTDLEWAISYIEALNPCRVDNYEDWLAVGMALHSTGEPAALQEWIKWSRQSLKFKEGDCEKKWESFNSSGVGVGTLAHMSKRDGWTNPFKDAPPRHHKIKQKVVGGSGGDDGGNIITFPVQEKTLGSVKEEIKTFLLSDPSRSEINAEKIQIRVNNPWLSEREVKQLFETQEEEFEQIESRPDQQKQVDELLRISDKSLLLEDHIPIELANAVKMWCEWLNIRPEVALTTILATASSLHTVGTKLIISRKRDFSVTPNMFAAIIAESGQKKSPIFRTFSKKPLRQLKNEVTEFYVEQCKNYEEDREKWVNDKADALDKGESFHEPEPQPPQKPAPFYFNHATGEGITTAAAANPDKTLFALIDELAGYFKSQDAYRQGKGSDKQEVLSYHDGEGKTVLRAGGVKADVDEIYLSIFGTIQPAVLKKLMGNADDEDGQWARFFFVQQPLAESTMDLSDASSVNLHERVTAVYRNCFAVPKQEYTLSPEAFKLYVPFYNRLEQLRVQHPNSGMRALYSKAEGHTGVLALNLHVIRACTYGVKPPMEIAAETMQSAISLMKFYIGQSKLLYADMDTDVASHLAKIIATSKRYESIGVDSGWVSARQIRDNIKMQDRKGKISIEEARRWIEDLVNMQRGSKKCVGKTVTKKGELYFHYKVGMGGDPLDEFGELGDALGMDYPQPETLADKGYDTLGDFGDNFSFSQNFEESKSPPEDGGGSRLQGKVEKINNLRNRPQNPQASCDEETACISFGETVSPNHPHDPQNPKKNVEEFVDKQIELSTTEVVPQVRDHDDAESTINIEFVTPIPKARVRVHCLGSNRDGRLGIVQCVRKARDPKGNILTNPDGSFVYEYVVKIDKCDDLDAKNLTYTCLVKQSPNSWLEVLPE